MLSSDSFTHNSTSPSPFLASVAKACLSHYCDLSDICFIFPNRRSGSFFLKNLSSQLGDNTLLAPEVLGIDEFVEKIAGRLAAPRLDLIFRLYNAYCEIAGNSPDLIAEKALLDFDRFAPWAETLISDFSEVEKYDVDAEALFVNVRDYREIASNFLTEQQIEFIARFFGTPPNLESAETFWKTVGPEKDRSEIKRKFVELWRVLPELHSKLLKSLEADGLALDGTLFQLAADAVEQMMKPELPWSKVVAVGFNMLSTSEVRLLEALAALPSPVYDSFIDFFWDATGPVLESESLNASQSIHRLMRRFPSPEWAHDFMADSQAVALPPVISVAAAPSNVAQVKIAADVAASWLKDKNGEIIKDARTAIVLPDENLLLPLLHSLPDALSSVNLTMGYSMRFTSVASFMFHLRRLHSRRCRVGEELGYRREDLSTFLAHPLVHALVGTNAVREYGESLTTRHIQAVSASDVAKALPQLEPLVRTIDKKCGVDSAAQWLDEVLATIADAIASDAGQQQASHPYNKKIEIAQIELYRQALGRLLTAAQMHGVEMNVDTLFHLTDRLISGERISFEGEPLEGLQVMGLLETRAIDFERVVVLSLNDKVLPRHARKRTFIPDALRSGYGLPLPSRAEELYSYYFYRLLSRAREVTLIYDARAGEGMRSGGKSRFLLQLEMLYAENKINFLDYSYRLSTSVSTPSPVIKTPEIMENVKEYLAGGSRNLSASAIMDYCQCPVRFYFRDVAGVKDEDPPSDSMDAITQGLVVHEVMEKVYIPHQEKRDSLKERVVISKELINSILENERKIRRLVIRAVNRIHYHLDYEELDREPEGAMPIITDRLALMVKNALRHDATLAPFELVGTEISDTIRWSIGSSPEVNVKYAIDRVDIVDGIFRIVDYKTGVSHVAASEQEDIFNGNYNARYFIQLLLYADILSRRLAEENLKAAPGIAMKIYEVNRPPQSLEVMPTVERKNVMLNTDEGVADTFKLGMEKIINDIFNPDIPFSPTDNEDNCLYCNLKYLCGKQK